MIHNTVLIIDNNDDNIKYIKDNLSASGYKPIIADKRDGTIESILDLRPDLVILNDEILKNKFEKFCNDFKSNSDLKYTPIIFISFKKDIEKLKIISNELVFDHILCPFDFEELNSKIQIFLRIKALQTEVDSKIKSLAHNLSLSHDLAEFTNKINSLNLDDIVKTVKERIPSLINVKYFTLYTYDEKEDNLKVLVHNYKRLKKNEKIICHASKNKIITPFLLNKDKLLRKKKLLIIPLYLERRLLGVLNLKEPLEGQFDEEDIDKVNRISQQLASAIRNCQKYKRIENLSITDELTGLYNYRYFQERLSEEFKRVRRSERPFSIILIDIDHFKNINDTYGHKQGDKVLSELAEIIKFGLRDFDIAARYGGEEFALLLPDTDLSESVIVAERTRKRIQNHGFSKNDIHFKVTISLGVMTYHYGDKINQDRLLEEADRLLYKAKKSGRNRVCHPKLISERPRRKTEVTKEEKRELF